MSTVFYWYRTTTKNLWNAIVILKKKYKNLLEWEESISFYRPVWITIYEGKKDNIYLRVWWFHWRWWASFSLDEEDKKYVTNCYYDNRSDMDSEDPEKLTDEEIDIIDKENKIWNIYIQNTHTYETFEEVSYGSTDFFLRDQIRVTKDINYEGIEYEYNKSEIILRLKGSSWLKWECIRIKNKDYYTDQITKLKNLKNRLEKEYNPQVLNKSWKDNHNTNEEEKKNAEKLYWNIRFIERYYNWTSSILEYQKEFVKKAELEWKWDTKKILRKKTIIEWIEKYSWFVPTDAKEKDTTIYENISYKERRKILDLIIDEIIEENKENIKMSMSFWEKKEEFEKKITKDLRRTIMRYFYAKKDHFVEESQKNIWQTSEKKYDSESPYISKKILKFINSDKYNKDITEFITKEFSELMKEKI